MFTLAERLKKCREDLGLSQAELAKRAKLKNQSIIGSLETGYRKKSSHMPAIAVALGVEPLWLAEGRGPKQRLSPSSDTQGASNTAQSEPQNLEPAPGLRGRVPLISFVQAGNFSEVLDNFYPGDGEDWIDVTCQVNRHTFALRVVGDSMEPDFPAGTIIVVEPDMSPEPGDYVVAKNGEDATFKQLTRDGNDWYLKPLNSRYPIKGLGESRIIGVVREAVRKFR